jgi:hypothetical protein
MSRSPILERTVTFALPSGKCGANAAERHNFDSGYPSDKAGCVAMIYDDLHFADIRERLGLGFVRPDQRSPSALASAPNEGKELLAQGGGITERRDAHGIRRHLDATTTQLRSEIFEFRKRLDVRQDIERLS